MSGGDLAGAFQDGARLRFTVVSEEQCPIYVRGDRLDVEGRRLSVQGGKATCLTLAGDIDEVLRRGTVEAPVKEGRTPGITCGGCEGRITLKVSGIPDMLERLDPQQRRLVEALLETLGQFSLFNTLGERELRRIVPEMKAGRFEPGAIVLRQGDPGRHLYIIVSGSVDVLAGEKNDILLTTLGKGEIFGEMSLLSGAGCSATIRVREPSRLLALDGTVFSKMIVQHPSLQLYLFRLLANRLRETNVLKEAQVASGIRGSLDDIELAELLQALHTAGKTGLLRLDLSTGSGVVAMKDGELLDVAYDKLVGEDAFFALLEQREGTFAFSPGLPPEHANRDPIGDFIGLLMEAFVRLDRKGSQRGGGPVPAAASSQSGDTP